MPEKQAVVPVLLYLPITWLVAQSVDQSILPSVMISQKVSQSVS